MFTSLKVPRSFRNLVAHSTYLPSRELYNISHLRKRKITDSKVCWDRLVRRLVMIPVQSALQIEAHVLVKDSNSTETAPPRRPLPCVVGVKHLKGLKKTAWRRCNSHVLLYRGPLLIHLFGVAPSTFTTLYSYSIVGCAQEIY